MPQVDLSCYRNPLGFRNKAGRALWGAVWLLLFRPSPFFLFGWRRFLLRLFGAKVGRGVNVYPSCRIWAPWNLEMGDYSCLSHHVECYSVAPVRIGAHAVVSQYSYLCTAGHDIADPHMKLVTAPITVGDGAWVAADVFVGPGVSIGDGAVVGARAAVFKDVPPGEVWGGNPARFIKKRPLKAEGGR